MSDRALRSRLIRMAHANTELRPHLLPLLNKQASASKYQIRGLGPVLKGWALTQMQEWAEAFNRENPDEEPIPVDDLAVTSVRDHGTWINYEIDAFDGTVWNVTIDMTYGTVEIENR